MAHQRLFLIEFNELSPVLLERFMDAGKLPAFRRFYDTSSVYITDAGERGESLMPWIAWPSIHSGMPLAAHGVFRLGDGKNIPQAQLGQLLSDAGYRVGICGSMNANYGDAIDGYVLPDPWDRVGRTTPPSLQPFFDVIAGQVKESSRRSPQAKRELAKLALFMLRSGISMTTVVATLRQLADERHDRGLSWRRASLLDQIQYDVFRHYNRKFDVRFATFYSNSTAHYQHLYWRDYEPAHFDQTAVDESHPSHATAIEYGYRAMDALLARFMSDYPNTLFVLATAHSQQPDSGEVFRFYRPTDFDALMRFAQIADASIKPVMSEQFHVEVADESAAIAAEAQLNTLLLDGKPALWVTREGTNVFAGCRYLFTETEDDLLVRSGEDAAAMRFGDLFYRIEGTRSGMHHPDGALWIRNGAHRVADEHVSILDIAPTILAHFGVQQPAYMRGRPLGSPSDARVMQAAAH